MGIFNGCLLACDIDGTLISGEYLPERNVEMIKYFVSEGGAFSLSTGRTAAAISMITSKIDCISPSVLGNGSVIYDFKKNAAIAESCLPGEALLMAREVLRHCDMGMEFHSASGLLVPSRSAASDLHEEYESMKPVFLNLDTCLEARVNKIIYFIETKEQEEVLAAVSAKYADKCTFYNTCAFIGGVKQNYLEQLPSGVSKAGALASLLKMLNIKKGGYFAIGDYYNDVPMVKAADIGAVTAEAPEDVKQAADKVVGSAADGAVADFIEYLKERFKNGQANET
ncbi:MAG: HAD-IIB family hydrolase [Clostridia bacterium]|nr:HAD-IIB family hydrolase [Clostridia bacterium]